MMSVLLPMFLMLMMRTVFVVFLMFMLSMLFLMPLMFVVFLVFMMFVSFFMFSMGMRSFDRPDFQALALLYIAIVVGQPFLEGAQTDGLWEIQFVHRLRLTIDRLPWSGLSIERHIVAQHAESEMVAIAFSIVVSVGFSHGINFESPNEEAHRRNIIATRRVLREGTAYIDRMRLAGEGTAHCIERGTIAHIYEVTAFAASKVAVLIDAQVFVELDDMSIGPASYVACHLFEQCKCPSTPSIMESIGDVAAWNQNVIALQAFQRRYIAWLTSSVYLLIADQIADVRHNPILAGLDKPVLIELGDIGLDDIHLLGDYAQEGLELPTRLRVTDAVHGRQEIVEAISFCVVHLISSYLWFGYVWTS